MAERTNEQVLDQLVYAVACAYRHYGPGLSPEGLMSLRAKLGEDGKWFTDASYRCDVYEDDEHVDFHTRILWPREWDKLDYQETVNCSRGLDADGVPVVV
jgi:hypothetical protein